ncbi:hypothetical protein Ahy_B02g061316 [Arachis hypogaea]|uniref:Uncharacterized protein n=1 Tax=Arachis hypogaea TaxID=3818 RepID=A0A445AKQ9_ARAHY|nr:hypothetical protein Ahy_B02g061316 [Arachis hypogaea]
MVALLLVVSFGLEGLGFGFLLMIEWRPKLGWRPYWSAAQKYKVVNGLEKFAVDLSTHECSCRRWQMSTYLGLDLEAFVADCYKKEAYLKCYESVIHPLNGPDLSERTTHGDVMPPPYRRPSHWPVKKRRSGAGEEEQSSRTHLSRGEGSKDAQYVVQLDTTKVDALNLLKMRPNNQRSLTKARRRNQAPTHILQLLREEGRLHLHSPLRKTDSATQPPSSAQSNSATQPKRPRGRPKGTTKPNYSVQPKLQLKKHTSPISSAPSSSSTQPNTTSLLASQPTLFTSSSQPVGHFSIRNSRAPHVSPKKLRLMAKLPPRK